jgi:hypothetical protein
VVSMARTLQSVHYWSDVNFYKHGFISSGFCLNPGSLEFPFAQLIPADLTGDGLWKYPGNVICRQHCRSWRINGSEFDQCYGEDPPFRNSVEHNQFAITLANPLFLQDPLSPARFAHQVTKGELLLLPFLINRQHGRFGRVLHCPLIDHIKTKVIIFWHRNGKILVAVVKFILFFR